MNKFTSWINNHAPKWIVVEHDPERTWMRVILAILSFAPLIGLLALIASAIF